MYLHIGEETVVRTDEVLGIFDIENTTVSPATRDFLAAAEQHGHVVTIGDDLPRSFVVCMADDGTQTVYISQISCATLRKRAKRIAQSGNMASLFL